jgi:alkylation response protein AidB-like acyl-CoA dehydrogenase
VTATTRKAGVPASVERLLPLAAEHAEASERSRQLAEPVVEALRQAGVFQMLVPRAIGGGETDLAAAVRTFEELSRIDASTGWIAMIGATSAVTSAYLAEDVARRIYARSIVGGVVAPRGTATPEGDGYRVSGRWAFASGCEHSDWIALACLVPEEPLSEGVPDQRFMLVPRKAIEVIDTWSVSGLRATGSHDVTVNHEVVRREHSYSMITGRPRHGGPLYGFSIMGLLAVSVAAVALGIGRGAIDDISALAAAKTPTGRRKTLADWAVAQSAIAGAEAELRAGRAFLTEATDAMWQTLAAGERPSDRERALVRLAATQAVRGAVRAVDAAYDLGGGSSIYETNTLQRRFRDIHTLTAHIMIGPSSLEAAGRVLLGIDVPPGFL